MDGEDEDEDRSAPDGTQRLDKWLWFARMAKSRTLAAQLVSDGKVRINRTKAVKPAQVVRPDDVLTIGIRGGVQVIRILAPGARRGPSAEARLLYEVLTPGGSTTGSDGSVQRPSGAGRPSKREHRQLRRVFGGTD
jgi:ribosome-associated heat shock protein Hsp15